MFRCKSKVSSNILSHNIRGNICYAQRIFDKFIEFCKEQNVKLNLTSLTADMTPQFESLIANKYSKLRDYTFGFM